MIQHFVTREAKLFYEIITKKSINRSFEREHTFYRLLRTPYLRVHVFKAYQKKIAMESKGAFLRLMSAWAHETEKERTRLWPRMNSPGKRRPWKAPFTGWPARISVRSATGWTRCRKRCSKRGKRCRGWKRKSISKQKNLSQFDTFNLKGMSRPIKNKRL